MNTLTVVLLAVDVQAKFQQNDPYGLGITLIAMVVVMAALALISLIFKALEPTIRLSQQAHSYVTSGRKGASTSAGEVAITPAMHQGAVVAAIGLALHEHFEAQRDHEIIALTISEVSRRYSPWSSKIYGVMNNQIQRR